MAREAKEKWFKIKDFGGIEISSSEGGDRISIYLLLRRFFYNNETESET